MNFISKILHFFGKSQNESDIEEEILEHVQDISYGKVFEGTSQIQCVCPVCEYGEGYMESFIPDLVETRIVTCDNCGTTFYGVDGFGSVNERTKAHDGTIVK